MSRTGTASFGTKSGVGGLWGAGLHLPELPLSGFVLRVLPHHGGINPGAPGHSELPWSLRAWDGDEEQRGPSPRAGSSTDQAVTPSLGTGFLGEAPVLGVLVSWGCAGNPALASHPAFCAQDLTLKLCLIRSICMISQAIYDGGKCGDFVFSRKAELVAQMVVRANPARAGLGAGPALAAELDPCPGQAGGGCDRPLAVFQEFIKAEPLDAMRTPVRQRAMVTCTYLVYPSSGGSRGRAPPRSLAPCSRLPRGPGGRAARRLSARSRSAAWLVRPPAHRCPWAGFCWALQRPFRSAEPRAPRAPLRKADFCTAVKNTRTRHSPDTDTESALPASDRSWCHRARSRGSRNSR